MLISKMHFKTVSSCIKWKSRYRKIDIFGFQHKSTAFYPYDYIPAFRNKIKCPSDFKINLQESEPTLKSAPI